MKNNQIPGLRTDKEHAGFIEYSCEASEFSTIIFHLESEYSYVWLLGIHSFEKNTDSIRLKYYFYDFEERMKFSIGFDLPSGGEFFPISHKWKNAKFYEDRILNKTNLKRKKKYRFAFEHKDERLYLPKVQIALDSNLRQNNNRLDLRVEDNKIVLAEIEKGRFEIGLEEVFKKIDMPLRYHALESYFPKKALFWSQLLTQAIEETESLIVPDRAKAIRMVGLELSRILNHLFDFQYMAKDFENHTLNVFSQLWIKKIQSLLISFSGNEFGLNIIRRGGVCRDINQSWSSRTIDDLGALEKNLVGLIKDFLLSIKFNEMALQVKLVNKDELTTWSLTGPLARAAGLNLDLRKRDPFYFYSDVEFDIPMGVGGTLFDLISVKIEEIRQSIGIIIQVLDNLPTGAFYSEDDPFKFFHSPFDHHNGQQNGGQEAQSETLYRNSVNRYLDRKDFQHVCFIEGPGGVMGIDLADSSEETYLRLLGSQFSDGSFLEYSLVGKGIDEVFPLWTALNLDLKEVER